MVIAAVAFCPHPPVLVPEVAQGAAGELDDLRDACLAAIRSIAAPGRRLVVLGAGPSTRSYPAVSRGTFAGFGVPLDVPLGSDEPGPVELPLSLTVGAWLVREALGPNTGAVGVAAHEWTPVPDDGPVALLVMGDGSACRSTAAPGYLDERAAAYDAAVAFALASGEGWRLSEGCLPEADDLLVAGTRVWDSAATAIEASQWRAELLYDDAPYGVGYFVAVWRAR